MYQLKILAIIFIPLTFLFFVFSTVKATYISLQRPFETLVYGFLFTSLLASILAFTVRNYWSKKLAFRLHTVDKWLLQNHNKLLASTVLWILATLHLGSALQNSVQENLTNYMRQYAWNNKYIHDYFGPDNFLFGFVCVFIWALLFFAPRHTKK